ncbi:MAG: TIGR01440 family protein [Oscillospiraceae bacterium]|nr:TIGR01440 family protein [Oscillospiraceae bacterium]
MLEDITMQAKQAATELLEAAQLKAGDIFVVGCSSSEMMGQHIGKGSSLAAAQAAFDGIYPVLQARGIYLAAQCCEHLNRALIIEEEAAEAYGYDPVNVCPWEHAGGSFATTAFARFVRPVAVEHIRAKAGIDIGCTLIGMHLQEVAVPVRLSIRQIGQAPIICARTRPRFIGGERARYRSEMR